jgi:pimeloyl-ACP methyl ester carboxylesterase
MNARYSLQEYTGDRFTSRFFVFGEEHKQRGTVLLLHGLFENCTVWEGFTTPFASALAKNFCVIGVDLLGHNPNAPIPPNTSITLRLMADEVMTILSFLGIESAVVVGHSMGGAVAMQCLKHYPEKLRGVGLFHATPFADTDEIKKNRNATIEALKAGGKAEIAETLLKRIIPESSWNRLGSDISRLRDMLQKTPASGMIAGHEAMRDREDTRSILQDTTCPILFLLGKEDAIINIDAMLSVAHLPLNAHVSLLHGVAHAGMIESPTQCVEILRGFAEFCFVA